MGNAEISGEGRKEGKNVAWRGELHEGRTSDHRCILRAQSSARRAVNSC
jgi:hypothetical protein